LLRKRKGHLAGGGYRGEVIKGIKDRSGYLLEVTMRNQKADGFFKPISKRWIVERISPGLTTTEDCVATMNCSQFPPNEGMLTPINSSVFTIVGFNFLL
jgi:hypothetical protein